MQWIKNILIVNLTGSVLLVIYFLIKRLFGERLSSKYLYSILRVNVLFFLIPLILVGEAYRGIWLDIKLLLGQTLEDTVQVTPRNPMFLQIEQGIKFSLGMNGIMILLGIYLIIAVFLFSRDMSKEHKKNQSVRDSIKISGVKTDPYLLELQKEYKIRKKIEVCSCKTMGRISSIGTFRPIIFFKDPGNELDRRILYSHELCHIKHHDLLWRALASLAHSIHFWNPATRILNRELRSMQEKNCDEWVCLRLDEAGRDRYATLLKQYATVAQEAGGSVAFAENESYDSIKERIDLIMKDKKRMSKRAATLLMVMILFTSSLTALAYDEIRWWGDDAKTTIIIGEGENYESHMSKAIVFTEDIHNDFDLDSLLLYEKTCTDEEGNIFSYDDIMGGGDSSKALCFFHSYKNYIVVEHYPIAPTGGCEMHFYEREMCQKCGYTRNSVLTAIDRFDVCPHSDF